VPDVPLVPVVPLVALGESVPAMPDVPVVPYVLPVEVELGDCVDGVEPLRLPDPLVLPAALPLMLVSVAPVVLELPYVELVWPDEPAPDVPAELEELGEVDEP